MQGFLGDKVNSAAETIKAQIADKKEKAKKDQEATKKVIEGAVTRGRDRPMMLSQKYDKESLEKQRQTAKLNAVKSFIEVLCESGMTRKQAMQSLSAEEKALLQEEEFVQRKKREYNRL